MSTRPVERRLHSRVAVPGVTARIAMQDGAGRRRRVSLVDLSLDGLCWHDAQPAENGTPVSIALRPHWLLGRTLKLNAVVVRHDATTTAAQFMARHRRSVRRLVAEWTGIYQYTIDRLLEDMIARSRQLKLRLAIPEDQARQEFTVLLTVQVMNYLHSGRHRVAL